MLSKHEEGFLKYKYLSIQNTNTHKQANKKTNKQAKQLSKESETIVELGFLPKDTFLLKKKRYKKISRLRVCV